MNEKSQRMDWDNKQHSKLGNFVRRGFHTNFSKNCLSKGFVNTFLSIELKNQCKYFFKTPIIIVNVLLKTKTIIMTESNQMSGYLMKKSTAGDWQKRWFTTNGYFLTYFKSQKMSKLLAALSLPQVGEISLIHSDPEGRTFQLDLRDRQYVLKGANAEEAKQWVETLIYLRDGGVSSEGKQTKEVKSASTTPAKSESGDFESNEVPTNVPSPKQLTNSVEGKFVKTGSDESCTAGCVVS